MQGPAARLGELYREVELRGLFDDSKTFADAQPLSSLPTLLSEFSAQVDWTDEALRGWVKTRFSLPETPASRPLDGHLSLLEHIKNLWPQLTRDATEVAPGSSLISLPKPYVAPGGRFRELYYWDSYFTMLGLAADGRSDLVEHMIENFVSLISRFGHIPNGTRTYYLGRSQPPVFHLMLGLSDCEDEAIRKERRDALRAEHAFWMRGADGLQPGEARDRVVALPDGAVLNRYFDAHDTPRDESFREDVQTAQASHRPAAEVFRDLRAGAESGWDFSSRWLGEARDLATIRTTAIAPIDLNSLLWSLERRLATLAVKSGEFAEAKRYDGAASRRLVAMRRWCFDPGRGVHADVLWAEAKLTGRVTAASLFPLFVGASTQEDAGATARLVEDELLAAGGLRTTLLRSTEQWDRPNGWAPLQWIAAEGLRRYGFHDLADEIARRWLATVTRVYEAEGRLLEKYDVEAAGAGAGGEYPLQDGFGWTNGVTRAFLAQIAARS